MDVIECVFRSAPPVVAAGAHTANVGDGMDMYMMISWFHFNMQDVVLFEVPCSCSPLVFARVVIVA